MNRLEAAMSAVDQIRALLGDDPDIKLLLDTIEGETEALELLDRFVERLIADKALIRRARSRASRLAKRDEMLRAVVLAMLEKFGTRRVERPLYAASVSNRTHAIVTDESELPDAFLRRAPDKLAIAKALRRGQDVAGATLSNPQPSLVIQGEPGEPAAEEEEE